MSMFAKRAGKFMKALLSNLNGETFTPIASIPDEAVSTEQTVHIDSTVKILSDMEYIEVQTAPDGSKSLRLTPSGTAHVQAMFTETL